MKNQLTSVDVWFLVSELNAALGSARIDKAYQLGNKELKIRAYVSGKGAIDMVISPGYAFMTNYQHKAPEQPSSFAMQLRKNLGGAYIREVLQHGFDRIIEFRIETIEKKYLLIIELFSTGNVMLCDGNKKILGLLEWQTWKDRTLKVGQKYEYPPETPNPLAIDSGKFLEIISKTNKKIAAAIATETGIGGLYAEELCLNAGIEKDRIAKQLSENEVKKLSDAYQTLIEKIKNKKSSPQAILENGKTIDVTAFDLEAYRNREKKHYSSFNEAADEFFSPQKFAETEKQVSSSFEKEKNRLLEIKQSQTNHLSEFEKESVESKGIGDLIYQEYQSLEEIIKLVNQERDKGLKWEDLKKKYIGKEVSSLLIENIDNAGMLTVKIKK
jgi:predicted ribosome quality control (RQC) complex YloA/Tae2 family protein